MGGGGGVAVVISFHMKDDSSLQAVGSSHASWTGSEDSLTCLNTIYLHQLIKLNCKDIARVMSLAKSCLA